MPQQTQKVTASLTPGAEADSAPTGVNLTKAQRYAGFTVA